jgi:L-rhamnose-H+ transport protein
MSDGYGIGLLIVAAAGVAQGSFMLPLKWTRRWEWENTWLVFASTAYLACPWLLVLWTMPGVFRIYGAIPARQLVAPLLFGIGWGTGALTFGLGIDAIGLAVGFAIILGVSACAGTLIPLVLMSGESLSATRWAVTVASLGLMLAGVAVCSFAGKWMEAISKPGRPLSYRKGVLVCLSSGILSSCGNLGFVYGHNIINTAQTMGVARDMAPNIVWALLTLPLFACNAGYSLYLLGRRHTVSNFAKAGTAHYYLFAILMGTLWIVGMVSYGIGARRLGPFGPSLGWSILLSTMVLSANLLGLASGEWRGAPPRAGRRLAIGLALLVLAVIGLGFANQIAQQSPRS